jgi:hypothetical protein
MRYKKLKISIYQQILHTIICNDVEKEIKKVNEKFYVNHSRYDFSGYSTSSEKHHLIILNKKHMKGSAFIIGTIAHEAFHITNSIFRRINIKPDANNDEAQAYLLTWIVEEVYKQFIKE